MRREKNDRFGFTNDGTVILSYDFDTFPSALSIRPHAFRWINEPRRLTHSSTTNDRSLQPTTRATNSEKFRVQLNVAGFNPETIQTRIDY
ncbi:unnamed protein product [Rotaria sp. Silwood1]|nr:unnamed protein product [Rotaria sp. Silwood1]CAF1208679.1 unnamed protein product [Rotaria sp. Silwood1]